MSRVVFFDIGDTLVHRPTVGPGKRLAAELGLPAEAGRAITRLVFREAFAGPAVLAERLRVMFDLAEPEPVVRAVWEAQIDEPEELPGASACIAAVAASGAEVGVISNIWSPYAEGFRRACPAIVPHVARWHLSYEAGVAKPDPALYRIALDAAGVAPADTVMIGDSLEKDVAPATELGMAAIWVPGPDVAATRLPDGAVQARDLAEVQALLEAVLATPGALRGALCAISPHAIGAS